MEGSREGRGGEVRGEGGEGSGEGSIEMFVFIKTV